MAHAPESDIVRRQYEALPYPARAPEDERKRLIVGSPSHLDEITHFVFKGRRPQYCRALIAGGGTGDAAIMLAQHLSWGGTAPATETPIGDVTYIDLSAASLNIAKARAEIRGLRNIRFIQGSLLDLPRLAPGPYDYIDCCGVLHHLPEPEEGLGALAAALAPGGGMGVMVYGIHGRTGVYMVQQALRQLGLVGADAPPTDRQLHYGRALVDGLAPHHWLRANPFVRDHLATAEAGGGDAGFYDLLLHSRDRAYAVDDCTRLAAAAGLCITGFVPGMIYSPDLYLEDPELRRRAASLPWLQQAALAEALSGAMKTHVFYLVREGDRLAGAVSPEPLSLSLVPQLLGVAAAGLANTIAKNARLSVNLEGIQRTFPFPPDAAGLIAFMDGRRTLSDIIAENQKRRPQATAVELIGLFQQAYRILHPLNLLMLRQSGVSD